MRSNTAPCPMPQGVEIVSAIDADTFRLTWTEKGGPAVQEPVRRSFGSRLINRLAEQLHGDVRMGYQPSGLVYELHVPLAALRDPHLKSVRERPRSDVR